MITKPKIGPAVATICRHSNFDLTVVEEGSPAAAAVELELEMVDIFKLP
jgi:hypothetical protein